MPQRGNTSTNPNRIDDSVFVIIEDRRSDTGQIIGIQVSISHKDVLSGKVVRVVSFIECQCSASTIILVMLAQFPQITIINFYNKISQ